MTLDFTFFAFAIPAVMFAGISKGGFGSGAAFAAAPFLALIVEPSAAVGLMLPLLMLIDLFTLKPYWRTWDWPSSKRLIWGSLPGVVVGAALWRVANPEVLKILIGSIALGFVAYQLARQNGWLKVREHPVSAAVGYGAGAAAGFTSFLSHAGGPPAAMYLLSRGLSKSAYQGTTVLVFWAINLAKSIPYGVLGIFTAQTLKADLYLAPAALIGAWIGVVAHRAIPERAFFAVTYFFLTVTGLKLIYDAL